MQGADIVQTKIVNDPLATKKVSMNSTQRKFALGLLLIGVLGWFLVYPGLMRVSGVYSQGMGIRGIPTEKADPETRHRERVEHMKKMCEQLVAQKKTTYDVPDPSKLGLNVFINEKYKFIYCSVPKIACTNWKRLLLSMNGLGKPETIDTSAIYNPSNKFYKELHKMQLNAYPREEALEKIKTYKKFIFVREPYERLLSAWRNKFTQWSNLEMHAKYGTRIIQQYRQNPSEASLRGGHDVTLGEFLRFILDPQTTAEGMQNEHWDSYENLCHPCAFQYDYIGKYETMSEDIDFILNKLNVTDVHMPDRGFYYHTMKTSEFIDLAYTEVPEQLVKQVWDGYYNDFVVFNYPYQNFHWTT